DPGLNRQLYGTEIARAPYIPFLTNGTDNDAITPGFQPVPNSCNGPVTKWFVNDNDNTGDHYTTAIGNDANDGSSSAPFATIDHAISVANAGDTIYVDAGLYIQNPVVNKAVKIFGSNQGTAGSASRTYGESVIRTNGNQTAVFSLSSANVIIDGLKIDGDDPSVTGGAIFSGDDANTLYGIHFTAAFNNDTIRNNIITKTAIGVRGDNAAKGNQIKANWFDGIGNYDFGYAISLRTNFYADIVDNKMTRVWTGVHLNQHNGPGGPTTWTMSGNEIHSYAGGLLYWLNYNGATNLTINNNQFFKETNAVANNAGVVMVSVQDAVTPTFTDNTITGHDYGVILTNTSTSNVVTFGSNNTITGTTIAAVYLTDNLTFNPVGLTDLTTNVYTGPSNNIAVKIDGTSIAPASGIGIEIETSRTSATDVNASAEILNTSISGTGSTGVLVKGSQASANIHNNASTITG
ncbi:MAG TPA: DUF1565 domain-containing protein, partial [Chitinophagaceae bacterium]|nr:DUF1565 domain-containing protein [Chitinophagaceae bacterium]